MFLHDYLLACEISTVRNLALRIYLNHVAVNQLQFHGLNNSILFSTSHTDCLCFIESRSQMAVSLRALRHWHGNKKTKN